MKDTVFIFTSYCVISQLPVQLLIELFKFTYIQKVNFATKLQRRACTVYVN